MGHQLEELEKIINTERIIELCANAVRLYDQRVINHGERVAYIAYRIGEQLKDDDIDLTILLMLCVFHDVGVYRTGELDQMMGYETNQVLEHCIYGYLFIKHFSPWPEYAEAIFHHHSNYETMKKNQITNITYASFIHLADYIDASIVSGQSKETILEGIQGNRFHPEYVRIVETLLATSKMYEILTSGDDTSIYHYLKDVHHLTFDTSCSLLEMLIYSIDLKSDVTVAHSITTAGVATFLGNKIGLTPNQIKKVQVGSLVHDIGKIATPREILEKKGKLTKKEYEVMQSHVINTETILKGVLSKEVLNIATRHHEKLDGSGYPHGLKAHELTIEERIVAVADLTSALLSKRSYKEGFSIEQTKELMLDMAERSFIDSQLATLVCENIHHLNEFIQAENQRVVDMRMAVLEEYHDIVSMG